MKKYQVYIDVSPDETWEEIVVETIVVEAFNANDAFQTANREVDHEHYYVWEVTEDDVINETEREKLIVKILDLAGDEFEDRASLIELAKKTDSQLVVMLSDIDDFFCNLGN